MQKANNIVDGIEQGLHSIYEGFGDGVKGIKLTFNKPKNINRVLYQAI